MAKESVRAPGGKAVERATFWGGASERLQEGTAGPKRPWLCSGAQGAAVRKWEGASSHRRPGLLCRCRDNNGCRSQAALMYTCSEAVEQPPACLNAVLTQHASELRGRWEPGTGHRAR